MELENHKTFVMCISKTRSLVHKVHLALTTPTQGVWEELLNYHPPPSNLNWTSMSKAKFIQVRFLLFFANIIFQDLYGWQGDINCSSLPAGLEEIAILRGNLSKFEKGNNSE